MHAVCMCGVNGVCGVYMYVWCVSCIWCDVKRFQLKSALAGL